MADSSTLFKSLGEGGEPFHGGRRAWPLPTKNEDGTWTPGEWRSVRGDLVPCQNGLHLCRLQDLPEWPAPKLYEAEYAGECITRSDKLVVRKARLLREFETWNERTMRLWSCDCAERVLPIYEKQRPSDSRPRQAIAVARRFANGEATKEELAAAWAASRDARDARDAAGDAAWAAAGAAARDASRDAAWAAAGAGAAAGAAAWAAAWAAEREIQLQRLLQYLNGEID